MQILSKGLQKDLYLQLFVALLICFSSAFLAYHYFANNMVVPVLGLIGFVLGLRFFLKVSLQLNIERNQLFILLDKHPERIVWVYSIITERKPFGFDWSKNGILYFKLIDGDEISVSLPPDKLKVVSRFLNRILKRSTFGFSEERARLFLEKPSALLREEDFPI